MKSPNVVYAAKLLRVAEQLLQSDPETSSILAESVCDTVYGVLEERGYCEDIKDKVKAKEDLCEYLSSMFSMHLEDLETKNYLK